MPDFLPEHGPCLVCGSANPKSLGLRLYAEAGRVKSEFVLNDSAQGPPGYAHGGAIAAILDEAMGGAVWVAGHRAVLANLNADFRLPTPLGSRLRAEAWVEATEGRKIRARAHLLLPGGETAAEARGLYVEAHHLVGRPAFGRT